MPNFSQDKPDLRELITKRSSIKGQITKFRNYLDSITGKSELSNVHIVELKLKIAKFESLSIKFDELQSEIEILNSENISVEIDARDDIEQDLIINIATAKTLLEYFSNSETENRRNSAHDVSCCSGPQETGVRLPQIQIAKFDGAYFRWLEFRDTFENLIHNNMRISPIHKFHYLVSYLEGDAARIISNLEVSSANYSEAWSLLCSRYHNKRSLINHHLNSLFNIKQLPRESERSLRFLVDHVTKNLRALASLGQPTDKWDILIIFMLSYKLDSNTLLKWEERRNDLDVDVPTLDQFYKFIIDRADVLESLNRNKHDLGNNNNSSTLPKTPFSNYRNYSAPSHQKQGQAAHTKSFASTQNRQSKLLNNYTCIICNDNHKIYDCPVFKAKGIEERLVDVSKYKLCANCLRQGHPVNECRMGPCRVCKNKHNSLIHNPSSSINNHVIFEDDQNESIINLCSQNSSQIVLLSTAIIEVLNPFNQQKEKVRALLDCGSQSSFLTKSLKDKLGLKSNPIDSLKVIGIGNNVSNNVIESCNIQINSLNSNFNVRLSCLVLNELTGYLPKTSVNTKTLMLPNDIQLADPTFNKPAKIDVLIGADIFWDILGNEQRSLGTNNPRLRNSRLGWLISGPIKIMNSHKTTHCNHVIVSESAKDIENIENMLTKFWEIEEVPVNNSANKQNNMCEKHFITHTRRDDNGRFCVKLPLNDSVDCLGDTYRLAKRRFSYLEKRFKRNPDLKSEYSKFIEEYANLGHLSLSDTDVPRNAYYLCHHAVTKLESETTKLRVVFDGSAPSSSGYSLNDLLMVGPNIQNSLFSILIRARQYKFLLTGDIEKMYRQILVEEEQRNLQLILWREDESQPLKTYKLNTITYGTASASYLSTRCLWQLGEESDHESIKRIIQNDFYVDDLIAGSNDEKTLKYIQKTITDTLKLGCFNLRKFKSNHPTIFDDIDINKQDKLTLSESSDTLGLGWTPSSDCLHFPIKEFSHDQDAIITKRFIMSNSFKIFDPLGLLSPVVVQAKIMLQKLWQQKVDWDQPVTKEINDNWTKFADNVSYLSHLEIPRLVLCDSPKSIELHSFSDASQSAYGACIFLRSINTDGEITVRLLCAKSKVAPLKQTTIPRLELCAALLAAKLCKSVTDSQRQKIDHIVHWCDSTVVLGWINSDPSKLKMFAANRISEIQELTKPSLWRYVPTAFNPADLISRGVDAKKLIDFDMWWLGPKFLYESENDWPILNCNNQDLEGLPEVKSHSATVLSEPIINVDKYSSLNKIQRTVAYVSRFIFNLKNPKNKKVGVLSVEEIRDAFHLLCAAAQRELFPVEYELLFKGKTLGTKCRILALSPFMDKDNLIRVGGRLQASIYSYEKKHPILLHASHRLAKLYFEKQHVDNMHAGPQLLLATVRETVWPMNGRHLARRVVNNCVQCRRLRGETLYPKMGDLPAQRINPDFPFLSVGLDFAGPFMIINRKGRGSRVIKCYLCLFVCLRFKCIHLEAVSDLSKDAFVMTLRRFVSRRGKPAEIFCDNGRNFVAAAKEVGAFLRENSDPLSDFASQLGIKFMFIPTYAPHFGGIWEAGVKSAKHHLKRVIGNSHLTFEEILTLFAQVEAILNSRPLCPLSSSPNDFLPLTPGHFMIGRPLTAMPSQPLENYSDSRLTRYERMEKIRQHFWQRWQKEYISELQQRTKWRSNTTKLQLDDMVLIHEDGTSPLNWRLGRVLRLFPGPDGISRVADIMTTRGCVRRPLVRICPLPTAEDLKS